MEFTRDRRALLKHRQTPVVRLPGAALDAAPDRLCKRLAETGLPVLGLCVKERLERAHRRIDVGEHEAHDARLWLLLRPGVRFGEHRGRAVRADDKPHGPRAELHAGLLEQAVERMALEDRAPGRRLRHAAQELKACVAPVEVLGLLLDLVLKIAVKAAELVDHEVEARREPADLIGRGDLRPHGEVALSHRIGSRTDGQQRPEDAPLHDEKHHEAHAHGAEENEGEDLLQECKTLVEPVLKRLDEPVDVLHERRNLLREAPPGLKTVDARLRKWTHALFESILEGYVLDVGGIARIVGHAVEKARAHELDAELVERRHGLLPSLLEGGERIRNGKRKLVALHAHAARDVDGAPRSRRALRENQSGGRGEYGQKADHGQNDEALSDNGGAKPFDDAHGGSLKRRLHGRILRFYKGAGAGRKMMQEKRRGRSINVESPLQNAPYVLRLRACRCPSP